jgi:hypothetical protein
VGVKVYMMETGDQEPQMTADVGPITRPVLDTHLIFKVLHWTASTPFPRIT